MRLRLAHLALVLVSACSAFAQDRTRTFAEADVTVQIELGDDDCLRALRLSVAGKPIAVPSAALHGVCGLIPNAATLRVDAATEGATPEHWVLLLPRLVPGKSADTFDSDSAHLDRYEFGFDRGCVRTRLYSAFSRDTGQRHPAPASVWSCGT